MQSNLLGHKADQWSLRVMGRIRREGCNEAGEKFGDRCCVRSLDPVMILWVYKYVKTYQIVHFVYLQFIV